MKLIFLQSKRFYFFSFFSLMLVLWMAGEIISLATSWPSLRSYQQNVPYFELVIGALTFQGIYFLYRELRNNQKEMDEVLSAFDELKNKTRIFNASMTDFPAAIENQFKIWKLSVTEKKIAVLLLRGLTNQQIAGLRETSIRTVENQTAAIYQKSGMNGKIEFITYFISGLLPNEGLRNGEN